MEIVYKLFMTQFDNTERIDPDLSKQRNGWMGKQFT
jgi:hypothetical protein